MVFTGSVQSDYQKYIPLEEVKKGGLVEFAGSDFETLKSNLLDYVKAVYPTDYNNFSESDLGVMLLELVAYMGAVLSHKADFLANENMVRTARQRDSVRKLFELIGVSLKGPISSAANALLTLDSSPTAGELTITPGNRVATISSPEDGAPLNFTIYKVTNGIIEDINYGGDIILDTTETDNPLGVVASSVYSNIALLEGSLVTQSGTFTTTNSARSINLTQSPVVEGSVEVFINSPTDITSSGVYSRVSNLYYASGADDNVFQVTYGDGYVARVVFGDGIVGNSPPLGSTYFITYRVGGGTRGNIANETINTTITIEDSLGTSIPAILENVSLATGGSDAESLDHAKTYAPLTFKQQNRLVSLEDFTSFANSFTSTTGKTGKAIAVTRKAYSSANIIDIYSLEKASTLQLQKASPTYKEELLQAIEPLRLAGTDVVVADGLIRTLDLVITARIQRELKSKKDSIVASMRRSILEFFNTDNFDFGKTFVLGELTRTLFNTKEVVFATVDNLDSDITVEFNEIIQLNNFTINVEYV